ncbi:MAG: hypothetical protein QQW96_13395 [Tychonema bourrellyi B0820]|uniref:Uncharacterized protein n=1 Tax=Tychonema bourrellyi FEM_GT703 TaxID=2040638 RepID=A0A2G4EV80_9CYAN|nr:hypothetical protein [Tychonema bourrellyi]MDQ2098631.1 hypothetical protein [Tychonema bourrellyi B0820]PHX53439.1 hypothetical protein CP500_021495 [Tychonema bourrellyi FEM_GT703]
MDKSLFELQHAQTLLIQDVAVHFHSRKKGLNLRSNYQFNSKFEKWQSQVPKQEVAVETITKLSCI